MKNFPVPQRETVSANNQAIFDTLQKNVGFVPNLYATFAHSDYALSNYLALANGKSSFKAKEKEVINLVVSEVNNCLYCLSAHTAIAKLNGFTEEQTLEIRRGEISFDSKLDALAKAAKSLTENKGHIDEQILANFYEAGYTKGSLIDAFILIGDKTITNYLYAATEIPVDWPAIQPLN
jgi:uncharacterized peroxidase-related enzyme